MRPWESTAAVLAMLIPILGIVGGLALGALSILKAARVRRLQHEERMAAIEKGIELPVFEEPAKKKREDLRKTGLIMTGIGSAITLSLWVVGGWNAGVWGSIPLFIGIALLISAKFARNGEKED